MRVAIFLPELDGGGERVMLDLAHGIERQGVEVDIVLPQFSSEHPYAAEFPPRTRLIDLHASSSGRKLRALTRYLRAEKPAGMFTFYDVTNVAMLAKRLARTRTVVVSGVHNTMSHLFASQSAWKAVLRRRWFGPALRTSDRIVAVSKGVADDLAHNFAVKRSHISVIYNPIREDNILAKAAGLVDHPFFAPDAPPVVIGVGHLEDRKDFSTLIQAFSIARTQQSIHLVILGEGSKRMTYEHQIRMLGIQDDVWMPGFVTNPYAYMARSAVFALSSVFEGLGMVLIEAMCLGTPVVSTDCPSGPAEILANGKYGRLVPMRDPTSLAKAIEAALNEGRPPIANDALDRFRLTNVASEYLSLL